MAEYIEREALEAKAVYMHGFGANKYVPLKAIVNAPAADVAPVVHGRWVDNTFCSNCNGFVEDDEGHIIMSFSDYCPNCGARMGRKDDPYVSCILSGF